MPSSPFLQKARKWIARHIVSFSLGVLVGVNFSWHPSMSFLQESPPSSSVSVPTETHCGDRVDNDNDGLVDCRDHPDCSLSSYCEENCINGIDDDGDFDVDCDDEWCTDDPNC